MQLAQQCARTCTEKSGVLHTGSLGIPGSDTSLCSHQLVQAFDLLINVPLTKILEESSCHDEGLFFLAFHTFFCRGKIQNFEI